MEQKSPRSSWNPGNMEQPLTGFALPVTLQCFRNYVSVGMCRFSDLPVKMTYSGVCVCVRADVGLAEATSLRDRMALYQAAVSKQEVPGHSATVSWILPFDLLQRLENSACLKRIKTE